MAWLYIHSIHLTCKIVFLSLVKLSIISSVLCAGFTDIAVVEEFDSLFLICFNFHPSLWSLMCKFKCSSQPVAPLWPRHWNRGKWPILKLKSQLVASLVQDMSVAIVIEATGCCLCFFPCCCSTVCSFVALCCVFKVGRKWSHTAAKSLATGSLGSNCWMEALHCSKTKWNHQVKKTLLSELHHSVIAYHFTILFLTFAKRDSNCGVQRRMSAERSLPAERMKKMTMKTDKGGEKSCKEARMEWGS